MRVGRTDSSVTLITRVFLGIFGVLAGAVFWPGSGMAQTPTQEWVAISSASGDGFRGHPVKTVTDAAGNVYMAGTDVVSCGAYCYNRDYVTTKYDRSGNAIWVARYDSGGNDVWADLAVDSGGNVYVTGTRQPSSGFEGYATVKYDANGNQVWVRQYGSGGPYTAVALVVDSAGGVYVTGHGPASIAFNYSSDDYITLKYDASGTLVWTSSYGYIPDVYNLGYFSGGSTDIPVGIALDTLGNVVVTGSTCYISGNSSTCDYATVRYATSNGSLTLVGRYDGGFYDQPTGLAVDGTGNIYVTGQSSTGQSFNDNDYLTIKYSFEYSGTATLLWSRRYDYAAQADIPTALTLDGSGNVFVTGTSVTPYATGDPNYPTAYRTDYATVKYSASGSQLWAAREVWPADSGNSPNALVADSAGNIYVAGQATIGLSMSDYATVKYDPSGARIWLMTYDRNGLEDVAYAIALDGSDNVYVAGVASATSSSTGLTLIKYAQSIGPQISSLVPASGAAGTSVTINGSGFGATQGTSTVTFNGVAATVTSWSNTLIAATVPCSTTTGPVVVTVGGVASNSVSFSVIPQISSLTPTSGVTGTSVTINGCGFGASRGTSTVTFNGLAATTYTTWGMTQVVANVPSDATTGPVAVRVGGNSSNTLPFTVVPSITSLSPTSGQGSLTQVTINGSGFGATQGTSAVTFTVGAASVAAPIVSWGNRQINATVPCLIAAGAGTVKVTVGGLASNTPSFTIQPSITTMTPTTGSVGTRVTITGCNWGSSQGTSTLSFNGVQTIVDPSRDVNDVWTYDRISTLVPPGTTTGPVLVTVGGQASNSLTFTITISIACAEPDLNCTMFPLDETVMWDVSLYPNGWTSDVTLLTTSIVNKDTGLDSSGLFTVSYTPNPVARPTTGPQTSRLVITVTDIFNFNAFGTHTVTITANGGAVEIASFEQVVDPIITLAGNGQYGFSGDGGQATAAKLYNPIDTVSDASGNIYIADRSNNRIRKLSPGGIITTVAGTGSTSCLGDGGAATSACISAPYGVALDSGGNLYIADYGHCRVRKVTSGGIISTVAGNGTCGFAGDGGAATSANLQYPTGVFVDGSGNIFIADRTNQRIRKVTVATGVITTIAGTGVAGFSGDGGAATSARLNQPRTIYVNTSGEVFVADASNHRVRKISATGVISTFAGTGSTSCLGDGGAAISACLYSPSGVSGDSNGNVYIADTLHHRIRKVAGGIISTVAGTGVAGYNGDNITPTKAKLQSPWGVHVHTLNGNKYMEIADTSNMRVRRVWPLP